MNSDAKRTTRELADHTVRPSLDVDQDLDAPKHKPNKCICKRKIVNFLNIIFVRFGLLTAMELSP